MKETDCRKCCVCAFKEDLCNGDFCEKYYREGNTEDFEKLLPHWIPCSERLPEEDVEVLISYHYKDGEGDTNHTYIDITTYGDMYFGGNKIGDYKHWREPFQYFRSNYEVIAWMPLPEPYRGEQK